MKVKNRKIAVVVLSLCLSIVIPATIYAQPVPDANDVDAPIDGGISLLIAAGAIVGAKKAKELAAQKEK